MRVFVVILLMCTAGWVQAADKPLYRFVDDQGVAHYTDKPPSKNAKPMQRDKLGKLSTAPVTGSAVPLPAVPRFAVHFDTPTPGQVYHDDAPEIPVALSVMPGLINGFGLMLKVDGENAGKKPLREIRSSLHGLGAGPHTIEAVLMNARGQELARSGPLKIHIQPAAVKK